MSRYTVDLVEYDRSWPARFDAAERDLINALGTGAVAIHHIGSTSVPGLPAKPTIDIAIVVSSIDQFVQRIAAVEALGYEYRPSAKFHDEHLFVRRIVDDVRTHHLHVVAAGCPDLDDWLDFRDYLRSTPEAARRYADVKRAMAKQHHAHPGAYVKAKTPIVEALLTEARAHARGDR